MGGRTPELPRLHLRHHILPTLKVELEGGVECGVEHNPLPTLLLIAAAAIPVRPLLSLSTRAESKNP